MTEVALYARRLAALPGALRILEMHPDGLPLASLAAELGTDSRSLREAFIAYYRGDAVELGDFRLPVVEFVGADGEEDDPEVAEVVRVLAADPERELGVEHLSADQLGSLYSAGQALLELEPGNEVLRSAIEAFRAGLLPVEDGDAPPYAPAHGSDVARTLHDAVDRQHQVRITYARAWHPGSATRVVEPWRVVRTRRGWELDAVRADRPGQVYSFLVSGIASAELLGTRFERPDEADALIEANRTPTWVRLVVPQTGRWAVERFAERVEVLDDDEDSVALRAALLPPVPQRLGLVLLSCGPEAFVMEPRALQEAGAALAARLLEHHQA